MSTAGLVQGTLTMPEELPLFNYQINFKNLRFLIEDVEVRTNNNAEQIINVKKTVQSKLSVQKFHGLEESLNNSLQFGLNTGKIVEQSETVIEKSKRLPTHEMSHLEQFCWKNERLSNVVEFLVNQSHQLKQKVSGDDRKNEKAIEQAFRRTDEKIQAAMSSINKTVNLYFIETNKKLSELETSVVSQKRSQETEFDNIKNAVIDKVSAKQLETALNGIENQVKQSLQTELSDDNMRRLAALNEYSSKLTQHAHDTDLKIKAIKLNMRENTEKVSKAMSTQLFEVQKHKLIQNISHQRNKIDDLVKKYGGFVDFRKSMLESNEKIQQQIWTVAQDVKRLSEQGSSVKKMENVGELLKALDPHLICELGNEVKLHQKQIGKLEKQVLSLEKELLLAQSQSRQAPVVNSDETSQKMTKMIKEFMSNLDFEGRIKRAEKDLQDQSKKSEGVNDLQKKIYMLGKEMDVGSIMKQIRKKADDETTRRQTRVIDGKVQKLFDFYKQVRKDLDEVAKKAARNGNHPADSVYLTTKKLYPANCLSCTPKLKCQRSYSRARKNDATIQDSFDRLGSSVYTRNQ